MWPGRHSCSSEPWFYDTHQPKFKWGEKHLSQMEVTYPGLDKDRWPPWVPTTPSLLPTTELLPVESQKVTLTSQQRRKMLHTLQVHASPQFILSNTHIPSVIDLLTHKSPGTWLTYFLSWGTSCIVVELAIHGSPMPWGNCFERQMHTSLLGWGWRVTLNLVLTLKPVLHFPLSPGSMPTPVIVWLPWTSTNFLAQITNF